MTEAPSTGLSRDRGTRLRRSVVATASFRVLILLSGVIAQPIVLRSVGADAYGAYAAITALITLAAFADLGLGNGIVSRVARLDAEKDDAAITRVFSTAFLALVAVGIVLGAAGLALSRAAVWSGLLRTELPASVVDRSAAVLIVCFALAVPFSLGQKVLIALQHGGQASAWLFASSALSASSSCVLAVAGGNLPAIVLGTAAPPAVLGIAQMVHLAYCDPRFRPSVTQWSFPTLLAVLRPGFVFFVLTLCGSMAYHADVWIVGALVSTEVAAILAVSARLFTSLQQLIASSMSQMWPAIAEARAKGDGAWIRHTLHKAIRLSGLASLGAAIAMLLATRPFVDVVFGAEVVPSWGLLLALATWMVALGVNAPYAYALSGLEKYAFQCWTSIAMAVANLGLSILLVTHIGVVGPLIASVVTQVVIITAPSVIYVQRSIDQVRPRDRVDA